ncbi:MAG: phosphoribosyltransferase [Candidatus Bathyarchaeota archaeon]
MEKKPISYEYYSPAKIFYMSQKLGIKILESGFNPDCLIGISRGGLWVVRILADVLDVSDIFTVSIKYYTGIAETREKPAILQKPPEQFIKNKSILVVDDVADKGYSLQAAVNLFTSMDISNVKTATLHYKPWSIIKPDYYIKETSNWIIYPWEIYETIRVIMGKKGLAYEEKVKELGRTGIPKKYFKLKYLSKLILKN